jgi:hypothetical protein
MRPRWQPGSSPLRSTPGRTRTCDVRLFVGEVPSPLGHGGNRPTESGRQESNLPGTAYQTVALPLGFGPQNAPCTGIEPVSPVRQTGRHASSVTGQTRAPGGSRTHLSGMASRCLDRSATGASGAQTARAEGVEPSACGLEPHCSPGSTPLSESCLGRTRTCNHPVNSGPLYRLSYKAIRDAGRSRTCFDVGLQPTAWPSGPGVIEQQGSRAGGGTRTH